jgi:hypothetical protein
MRDKYFKASPFPKMEDIKEDLDKVLRVADDFDHPGIKEYFKEDLNWPVFDKTIRSLKRIDKKISAKKQFSRDIPMMRKKVDDAKLFVKVFEDFFDEFGEDDTRVEEFEAWGEKWEAEHAKS